VKAQTGRRKIKQTQHITKCSREQKLTVSKSPLRCKHMRASRCADAGTSGKGKKLSVSKSMWHKGQSKQSTLQSNSKQAVLSKSLLQAEPKADSVKVCRSAQKASEQRIQADSVKVAVAPQAHAGKSMR
jgi:hypothetical protein